jgi:hypothetical protein
VLPNFLETLSGEYTMLKHLLVLATALISIIASPLVLAGKQVWQYDPETYSLVMVRDDGAIKKKKMVKRPKIKLVDVDGNVTVADINELASSAEILKIEKKNRKIKTVVLRQQSSGSSDCSFDALDYKDLEGPHSFSWDCATDLVTETETVTKSCSFDGSMDSGAGGNSMDVAGDCDYTKSTPESIVSWSCTYDASAGASGGAWGGDSGGDASFSCSWSSNVELVEPLWQCNFDIDAMSFMCASESEKQEFGFTFAPETMALLAEFDFQTDFVDSGPEANAAVSCSDNGGGSYSCSFDAPTESGDCSMNVSFDNTSGAFSGDLSGDISFSCSYSSTL